MTTREDKKVTVLRKVVSNPNRPSQSFSEGEVGLLADIFDSLHSEDAIASRQFARHPDMKNVVRKIGSMKAKFQ